MSIQTRSQKLARAAYEAVTQRQRALSPEAFKEYASFARGFAALIHACGLAQAVAFAVAKRDPGKPAGGLQSAVADDLARVLTAGGHANVPSADALAALTRESSVSVYLRLTRDALEAAVWLKRYVEGVNADGPTESAAKVGSPTGRGG